MQLRGVIAVVMLSVSAVEATAQRVKLSVPMDELVLRAERDSNDAPAHYEVALGYWLTRKYDLAERHLRQAILVEPKTAAAPPTPAS